MQAIGIPREKLAKAVSVNNSGNDSQTPNASFLRYPSMSINS